MDEESIPSQHDMTEVHALSGVVARLEQELDLARLQLRDAWARVPYDVTILRKPWKSDIAVGCRSCGKPTRWRTAKGLAEHQGECPSEVHIPRGRVSDSVWNLLTGVAETPASDESLDDD